MSIEFWRQTHRRAFSATRKTLGLESRAQIMLRALAAIAVVSGLALWGSKDAAGDELIFRGVGIGFILAIFPALYLRNFYRAPTEMERERADGYQAQINELQERIRVLEDERQQLLIFEFRPEDNKFFENDIGRVSVKNISEVQTASNLKTTLIHYWEDGAPIYTTVDIDLTSWQSGKVVEDVGARRNVTYDLFRLIKENGVHSVLLGPRPDGSYRPLPAGRYKLKITATASNLPPLPNFFLLDVGPDGLNEYRPWREGDSVHELQAVNRAESPALPRPKGTERRT